MINIWENKWRTMKANMLSLLVMFSFLVSALAPGLEANDMEKHNAFVGGGEKELVTEGPKASLMEPA
jgi:hypothetical protein